MGDRQLGMNKHTKRKMINTGTYNSVRVIDCIRLCSRLYVVCVGYYMGSVNYNMFGLLHVQSSVLYSQCRCTVSVVVQLYRCTVVPLTWL